MHVLTEEIIALVRDIGGAKKKIDGRSRIFHDLGIAGDDAHELLENIRAKFNVSFVGFKFERYFPDEAEALGRHIANLFGRRGDDKAPLTVDHLIAVAKQRAWFDPAPNV